MKRVVAPNELGPPDETWQQFRDALVPRTATTARAALAERYSARISDRQELRRAVGGGGREGLHSIIPYKEAFSPQLVRVILDHSGVARGRLLDPFVGAGTSLLVAAERQLTAVGLELLPFAAFASHTIAHSPLADWDTVSRYIERIETTKPLRSGTFPDFPVRDWAFTAAALAELTRLHQAITRLPNGIDRDVIRLALLCIVEQSSQATKDGTSLRRRPHGSGRSGRFNSRRTRDQVRRLFLDCLSRLKCGALTQPKPRPGTRVVLGDAKDLATWIQEPAGFDIAVFSPPYPNRYDYTANYQLELGFGFVQSREDLKALRRCQLRSHLEAPWPHARTVRSDALDEFLAALIAARRPGDQSGRVFKMVAGYFEDMAAVLSAVASQMKPGAPVAITVGTQVFAGQELPTDLLLAELANGLGYAVKDVWLARKKGVAVQQRSRFAILPQSRESVLLLEA